MYQEFNNNNTCLYINTPQLLTNNKNNNKNLKLESKQNKTFAKKKKRKKKKKQHLNREAFCIERDWVSKDKFL